MSSIDNRVVQMQFDNKEFEKNISDTTNSLEKLKRGLDMSKSAQGFDTIKASADKLSLASIAEGVEKLTERLSTMGIVGIQAIQNITNRLLNMGIALGKSISIDQISAGFGKYEKKTTSVQTIMNATGKTINEVNGYLDQLMWFSDETSYGFTDMTAAVSQLTTAGGDIDKIIPLITGVANATAFAGKGANEFSRAMYNLNQSYSAGSLQYMDWKSLELAGIASVQLKEALIEAGVAAGKIKPGQVTTANFNQTLKDRWADTKVMEMAFGKFGEMSKLAYEMVQRGEVDTAAQAYEILGKKYYGIGIKAAKAAQEAKTFSEAIEATKDAVSSGWMKTYEIIFGNYVEAKELWTGLSNELWELFAGGSQDRNEMLQEWKNLGGRDALIKSFANAWEGLKTVIGGVKESFRDIFPKMDGGRLFEITKRIEQFTEKLKPSEKTLENIKNVFRGFFSILDIGKRVIQEVLGKLIDKLHLLKPFGDGGLDFLGNIGKSISDFRDKVVEFDSVIEGLVKVIGDDILSPFFSKFGINVEGLGTKVAYFVKEAHIFENAVKIIKKPFEVIGNIVRNILPFIREAFDWLGSKLGIVGEKIRELFGNLKFDPQNGLINTAGIAGFLLLIRGVTKRINKFVESTKGFLDGIKTNFDKIGDILDTARESLMAWQQNIRAKTLLSISIAVGILAAALVKLSFIEPARLVSATVAIGAMMAQLVVMQGIMSKLPKGNSRVKVMAGLLLISIAISMLATAAKKMASIDSSRLATSVISVGILMAFMVATANNLKMHSKGVVKGGIGLILFAHAINVLTKAVQKLSEVDTNKLMKGLLAVGVLMAEMAIFSKLADLDGVGISGGLGLIALSTSVLILAGVAEKMSKLSVKEIVKGVGAVGIMLTELAIFSRIAGGSKKVLSIGIGMIAVATAMRILVKVVETLGSMSVKELTKGLGSIAFALLSISLVMNLMPKGMMTKSISLIFVATAITILGRVVQKFANIPWNSLIKGLTGMAGMMVILAVGLNAMKTSLLGAIALTVASVAINAFVLAIGLLGSMPFTTLLQGLLGLAAAFGILFIASAALSPMIPVLFAISAALALLGVSIAAFGAGALALTVALTSVSGSIVVLGAAIAEIIKGIIALIPFLATELAKGFVNLIAGIADRVPQLVESFKKILGGILEAIQFSVPEIVRTFLTILDEILKSIAEYLPSLIESGMSIIKSILKGIKENIFEITTLGIDIVLEFLKGVASRIGDIVDTGLQMVLSFINGLADAIRNNKEAIWEAAANLISALVEAILAGLVMLWGAGCDMLDSVFGGLGQALKDLGESILQVGVDIVNLVLGGIGSLLKGLWDAGCGIVQWAYDGISSMVGGLANGIKEFGEDIVGFFTGGIEGKEEKAKSAGSSLVRKTNEGIEEETNKERAKVLGQGVASNFIAGLKPAKETSSKLGREIGSGASEALKKGVNSNKTDVYNESVSVGTNVINGMKSGIDDNAYQLAESATRAANWAIRAAKNTYEVRSPSRVGIYLGKHFVGGQIKGIEDSKGRLSDVSESTAQNAIKVVRNTFDNAVLGLGDISDQPVIKPILDLDRIKDGVRGLKDIFSLPPLELGFSGNAVSLANPSYSQSKKAVEKETTVTNNITNNVAENATFYVREEADIEKIGKEIAEQIDRDRRG